MTLDDPPEPPAIPDTNAASTERKRPFTILIVDDEEDIRTSLAQLIEAMIPRTKAVLAGSGPEGLEALQNQHFDLIITDQRMPGMLGTEFLDQARSIVRGTPAIMVTAYPDLQLAIDALNNEYVTTFLTKPFDKDEIIERIEAVRDAEDQAVERARAVAAAHATLRRQANAAADQR